MRLASIGAGKWQNTGGDKAKFGPLAAPGAGPGGELKQAGCPDALQLLHFHMGSQISNVRDIAERHARGHALLRRALELGLAIDYVDVGGGLGSTTRARARAAFCSINYGLDQYAQTIVAPLAEACADYGSRRRTC
jgi:arginine decarboxylase